MVTFALDWLLFPFARNFDDGSCGQARWDRDELGAYTARIRMAGVTTLMVNYLDGGDPEDDGSFGGAWVISGAGEVLAEKPLGRPGLLLVRNSVSMARTAESDVRDFP